MLQNHRAVAACVVVVLVGVASTSCASTQSQSAGSARYRELRAKIKEHVHLNLHCWCRVIEPLELKRDASASLSMADAPVLVSMLSERDLNLAWGAQALLEQIGPPAIPYLRPFAISNGEPGRYACAALQTIDADDHKRRDVSPYLELDDAPEVGFPLPGADLCAAYADSVADRRSIRPNYAFFHARVRGRRLFVMTDRQGIVISVGPE